MNIFHKIARQSLKNNRTRTLVTIIGVILSSALITAVATFGVSLLDYMTRGAVQKYGDWHVAFEDVDTAFMQEQTADTDVSHTAAFENMGYAVLEGSKTPGKPYLFLAGFNSDTFDTLPVTLFSGRIPQNDTEVLISGSVATKGGVSYQVGDTITLDVGQRMNGTEKLGQDNPYMADTENFVSGEQKTYTVVGICKTPSFEKTSAPGYTLITYADHVNIDADLSVFVTLKNPRQVQAYAEQVAGEHVYMLNNEVLRFMGVADFAGDKIFTTLLYSVVAIVLIIIMIGSVFLIYNSFYISLNERTQQIGILASVGATGKQIKNSVLFEGLCIGAVGIPIGVLAGIGSTWGVIAIVAKNFGSIMYSGVSLGLVLSIPAIALAILVSLVTILISAYIPAKKAAATPVMECIRQTNEVKVESKALRTPKLVQRMCGLEGMLALKNFKRNKKRYRSIVLSLILSIVLFISTSAFVMDLEQIAAQAKTLTSYDIGFSTQEMNDDEMLQLYESLKTVQGVYDSSYQSMQEYDCTVQGDALSEDYWAAAGVQASGETVSLPVKMQFLDDVTYENILKSQGLPVEEYTGEHAKIIGVAKMRDDTNQKEVDQLSNMFRDANEELTITSKSEDASVKGKTQDVIITFADIVPPDTLPVLGTTTTEQHPYDLFVMAPYSMKDQFLPTVTSVKGLGFLSQQPAKSLEDMTKIIQGEAITEPYTLLDMTKMMEESRNEIFIANVFAYTFIIMISLIAVANVFNTISTNIRLRRRELAMLRSVGMPDRNFNRMMRFECAFYGMRALLFGLPISVLAAWLIYQSMLFGGADGIRFHLPWTSIGISVISVLLVIFVTMMYAVRKIKKENIIDALRDEMT
ncbi:MAG: FtsX-like permease family protein [Lachnospiraceae bacterium]|nr:FtsX-like permease family protein [Lachnospiraceae bacterium]